MSSPVKAQFARANGALSHGPVTPEGKERSARNATRHGLLSSTIVLEGESQERFDALLSELTADLQPRNSVETALVETMAAARWRYLRILGIQKAQFDIEMARQTGSRALVRATTAFRDLSDNSHALDLLLRYEVAFDRQYTRALNSLLKLRATRAADGQRPETVSTTCEKSKFPNEPNPPCSDYPVAAVDNEIRYAERPTAGGANGELANSLIAAVTGEIYPPGVLPRVSGDCGNPATDAFRRRAAGDRLPGTNVKLKRTS